MTLFDEEFEQEAITRIRKFAKIADSMGFEVAVGFSGGKDSQVVYDLCKRSGVEFKAYFNHAFESCETLNFIREHYPDVIWRRQVKQGFLQNIWTNLNGLLPTVELAYCCADYKHNAKQVDPRRVHVEAHSGVFRGKQPRQRQSHVSETNYTNSGFFHFGLRVKV